MKKLLLVSMLLISIAAQAVEPVVGDSSEPKNPGASACNNDRVPGSADPTSAEAGAQDD